MRPYDDVDSFFNRFFDNFLNNRGFYRSRVDANMYETEDAFVYEFALPGVDKKDIQIDVEGDMLHVRVADKSTKKSSGQGYSGISEQYFGFEARYSLPQDADKDNISAKYENGLLTVSVPKLHPTKKLKGKSIKIQ